jgi:hypothetical protein
MKKPPCIRGLPQFKKGCPGRGWDGESGCPAWIEINLPTKGGERVDIKECVDLFHARLQLSTNQLLEGNQQAIESFRNNMTEIGVDGVAMPKVNPLLKSIVVGMLSTAKGQKMVGDGQDND